MKEEDAIKEEEHRPWGYYRVLEDKADHKVKRVVIYPGQRMSLQRHRRRSEHWYIIQGKALVTRDRDEFPGGPGTSVDIPVGSWHRIRNTGEGNTVLIEVQTGDYFGEDDIERAQDDYGRIQAKKPQQ